MLPSLSSFCILPLSSRVRIEDAPEPKNTESRKFNVDFLGSFTISSSSANLIVSNSLVDTVASEFNDSLFILESIVCLHDFLGKPPSCCDGCAGLPKIGLEIFGEFSSSKLLLLFVFFLKNSKNNNKLNNINSSNPKPTPRPTASPLLLWDDLESMDDKVEEEVALIYEVEEVEVTTVDVVGVLAKSDLVVEDKENEEVDEPIEEEL
ncbi:hypothetical protein WICMUC_001856 [Wickerhamomyces mucosus]|uniref:Uncharacterized protein n=1 Tax=Wickerhamomyces mucosus TaxID=1378264 RepID=A0A9P8TFL9_9ASCO|nr:hypothetical protein WICMUC_001856 [Wickerhamomyces mucosus]